MITFDDIKNQEKNIKTKTFNTYGKFCDYALDSIELLFQSILYINIGKLDENGEFKDFDSYFRFFTITHYNTVCYTFLASRKLLLNGYYSESAILQRNILETFVRLKYIKLKSEKEYIVVPEKVYYKVSVRII